MAYYKTLQVGLTTELLTSVRERAADQHMKPTQYVRSLICTDLGVPNPDSEGDDKWEALERETA